MLEPAIYTNTQRLLEMNVIEERRFLRPRKTPNEAGNKLNPDLRKAAWHGVHCRRQGRSSADVRAGGIIRLQIAHISRNNVKHIPPIASYPIIGSNTVETVLYTEPRQSADKGLVWINARQYFNGVPPEVWSFCLGGCQICQKWLKDREGRCLSNTDIRQYQRIVTALKEMIDLMAGIDAVLQNSQTNEQKLSIAAHR